MNTIKTKQVKWLNIKNPSKRDLAHLKRIYKLHPITLQELLSPSLRPKVEEYDDYLYMVLHFPVYNNKKKITSSVETNFVILKDTIITVHYETLTPLKELWTKAQLGLKFRKDNFGQTAAYLLYSILKTSYNFSLKQLDYINKKINQIENKMFDEKGSEEMVVKVSLAKRNVIDFRKVIKPQEAILESLKSKGVNFFNATMAPYFTDILSDFLRVRNSLEGQEEVLESLSQTNDSLVNNRTNKIIRLLTVFSVIVFPLTLLASIFGMNTKYLPLVGYSYDFWVIFGIMILATIFMLLVFKSKKWI